jgi:hypothetical protein
MLRRLIATERVVDSVAAGRANKSMAYRFLVVSRGARRVSRQWVLRRRFGGSKIREWEIGKRET